ASRGENEKKAIANLQEHALARTHGALYTVIDSTDGIAKQDRLEDKDKIAEKIKALEKILADENLPGRLKVQALADAWAAGDFKDPTKTLLPLTRKLALESKDEQVRLAAVYCMMKSSKGVLEKADFDIVRKGVTELAEKASNNQVKEEASMILAQFKKGDAEFKALIDQEKELDAEIARLKKETEEAERENKALADEVKKKRAELEEERQMQKDGVRITRGEVLKNGDKDMSIEDRVKKLNEAIQTP